MGLKKTKKAVRILAALMLIAAAGCSARVAKPVGEPPAARIDSLDDVEAAIDTFEDLEASGKVFFGAPAGMRSEEVNRTVVILDNAAMKLAAFARSHAEDTKALLLKARLLRAQDAMAPRSFTGGPDGMSVAGGDSHTAEVNDLLDRVLTREPDNAEAHYWKARVSALQEPVLKEGKFSYEGGDVAKVIHHATRAVRAAPNNLAYREYLAQALIAVGRADEALDLMKDVSGGSHPIYRLLSDWKLIPLPEGTVLDELMTVSMVQMAMESEDGLSFPNLRVAAFAVPSTLDEVAAFYRSRWNSIRPPEKGDRSFRLSLEWKGTELVPADVSSDEEEPVPGVQIMITEFSDGRPEVREALKLNEGQSGCYLVIINFRDRAKIRTPRGEAP